MKKTMVFRIICKRPLNKWGDKPYFFLTLASGWEGWPVPHLPNPCLHVEAVEDKRIFFLVRLATLDQAEEFGEFIRRLFFDDDHYLMGVTISGFELDWTKDELRKMEPVRIGKRLKSITKKELIEIDVQENRAKKIISDLSFFTDEMEANYYFVNRDEFFSGGSD